MITTIAQKITAFILVFILFAHNINTIVIIGEFVVNQDFIAKTLCIQKENQQGCNGKCQLRKELSENNSESIPENPMQESKRVALDAFCLSEINKIEIDHVIIIFSKEKYVSFTPRINKMYLEIDTPPPNFS